MRCWEAAAGEGGGADGFFVPRRLSRSNDGPATRVRPRSGFGAGGLSGTVRPGSGRRSGGGGGGGAGGWAALPSPRSISKDGTCSIFWMMSPKMSAELSLSPSSSNLGAGILAVSNWGTRVDEAPAGCRSDSDMPSSSSTRLSSRSFSSGFSKKSLARYWVVAWWRYSSPL